jgi:hypothetical protein
MSQRSRPHLKLVIVKQQLKKCTGRLDKVLKNGTQVEAMADEVDVTMERCKLPILLKPIVHVNIRL